MIEINLFGPSQRNHRLSPVDLRSSLEHRLVQSGCVRRGTSSKVQKRFDSDCGRILVELKYLFLWSGDELGGRHAYYIVDSKKKTVRTQFCSMIFYIVHLQLR